MRRIERSAHRGTRARQGRAAATYERAEVFLLQDSDSFACAPGSLHPGARWRPVHLALLIPRDSQASKQLGIEQRLWLAAGRRSQLPGWSDVRPIQPVATLDPILSFHYPESIMQKGKVRRVSALYRELQRLELLAGQRIERQLSG